MTTELYIYDEIGPEWYGMISATQVISAIHAAGPEEPLTIRINSPGGVVDEATAIYNALRRHPAHVTIEIDALAASAASYVAMAGDTIGMAENAMLMIHNPWTLAWGDANELEATASTLRKYEDVAGDTYAKRTGQNRSQINAWMEGTTYFTASEAVEAGFADAISQPLAVKACVHPLLKLPKTLTPEPEPSRQLSIDSSEKVPVRVLQSQLRIKRQQSRSPLRRMM